MHVTPGNFCFRCPVSIVKAAYGVFLSHLKPSYKHNYVFGFPCGIAATAVGFAFAP